MKTKNLVIEKKINSISSIFESFHDNRVVHFILLFAQRNLMIQQKKIVDHIFDITWHFQKCQNNLFDQLRCLLFATINFLRLIFTNFNFLQLFFSNNRFFQNRKTKCFTIEMCVILRVIERRWVWCFWYCIQNAMNCVVFLFFHWLSH